jgi:predicted GIY-YIG superfamily endonuclease
MNAIKAYVVRFECIPPKFYVGTSADVEQRIRDHVNGRGSAWCRHVMGLYKLTKCFLVETRDAEPLTEDMVTKEYMMRWGIDNVRGGSYSQIELDDSTIGHLLREFGTATNACFRCGALGHFVSSCPRVYASISAPMHAPTTSWLDAIASVATQATSVINAVNGLVNGHAPMSDAVVVHAQAPVPAPMQPKRMSAAAVAAKPFQPGQKCFRCGRNNHYADKCYATTHYDGSRLQK